MPAIRRAVIALAAVSLPAVGHAEAFAIPNSQVINLPAAANGLDYQLYVHVPPECGSEHPRCSTVYLLDAEYSFGLSSLIVTHLADRGRIPPLITVAIGYPDKRRYHRDRTRDYTPYHHPTGGYGPEVQQVSGGGPAFLDVIRHQIIPLVEAKFPASARERTLVGHSYGGLFATYAWIRAPEVFDNYIIVSPSLWYAEGRPLRDLAQACAPGSTKSAAVGEKDMFLVVGAYEEQPEQGRLMVTDLKRMHSILDRCEARKTSTYFRVYEDETHASIFPAALSTGLRKHFQ